MVHAFFPFIFLFHSLHTSVFSVVSYICLIKKKKQQFLIDSEINVASEIADGSAVLFLRQCPKFTELFL